MSKIELSPVRGDNSYLSSTVIQVSRPKIHEDETHATISCDVVGTGLPGELWFRVPLPLKQYLAAKRPDWIYTALLLPAMLRGADLIVDAPISDKLYFSISGDLQYVLKQQDKRLQNIAVRAGAHMGEGTYDGKAVGTGFSAGIDSFASILDNTASELPRSHRLSHLTVLNVGAMGPRDKAAPLFKKYVDRLWEFCNQSELGAVSVDSNLDDFYQGDFTYQQSHTIRGVAAIMTLQGMFRRYYYSSGYEYSNYFIGPTHDMASSDPIILPMLSTEQLEFISLGSRYSRLEKAIRVASYPESYKFLDVCVGNADGRAEQHKPNCSRCWKCGRQLLTLEALGKLDIYNAVFDLATFKRARTHIVAEILEQAYKDGFPSDQEVIEFSHLNKKIRLPMRPLLPYLIKYAPRRGIKLIAKLCTAVA